MEIPKNLEFLKNLAEVKRGYEVKCCWGVEGCPNSLVPCKELLVQIKNILEDEKITEFLLEKTGGKIKRHNVFRVGIAGCPNCCSQIHIMDIGIHGFVVIEIDAEKCDGCGECKSVCEEEAIVEKEKRFEVDPERCLGCGMCARVCKKGAINIQKRGYKLYIGGKLGRHPRLASLYGTYFTEEEVLKAVKEVVEFYKSHNQKGERLGTILQRKQKQGQI